MKPWPWAPDWMDAWDGEEPLLTFLLREGPKVDVPGAAMLFDDRVRPLAGFDLLPCDLCRREEPCGCGDGDCRCSCLRCSCPLPMVDDVAEAP